MDKAPVSDAGDCEFKSRLGRKKKKGRRKERGEGRQISLIHRVFVALTLASVRVCLFVCFVLLLLLVVINLSGSVSFSLVNAPCLRACIFFFRRTHPNPNRHRRPSAVDTPRILIPDL